MASQLEADESEKTRCQRCCACFRPHVVSSVLLSSTFIGVALGVILRFVPPFDNPKLATRELQYLFYGGELIIRFTMYLSIPMIVSSLISSIGGMDRRMSGSVAAKACFYYVFTTCVAVMEGFAFIYTIRPGTRALVNNNGDNTTIGNATTNTGDVNSIDTFIDMLRNLVPDNFVAVCFRLVSTTVVTVPVHHGNETFMIEKFTPEKTDNMNMLGISFFSIIFGLAFAKLGNKGKVLFGFFESLFESIMIVFRGLIWLYPVASICTMSYVIIKLEDPIGYLQKSFLFILSVILGLLTHVFLILPGLYLLCVRRNPFKYMFGCTKALVTAFATGNSSLTLPVTMDTLKRIGLDPSIVRYMCPIGTQVNMDGVALYEAMACIFLAQLRGLVPTPGQVVALGFTSVALSIGAPTMGNVIVLMMILFSTIGLPIEDVFLLMPFNWLLNRFRTMTNVWGDCVGTGIIAQLSHQDLARLHSVGDLTGSREDETIAGEMSKKRATEYANKADKIERNDSSLLVSEI